METSMKANRDSFVQTLISYIVYSFPGHPDSTIHPFNDSTIPAGSMGEQP